MVSWKIAGGESLGVDWVSQLTSHLLGHTVSGCLKFRARPRCGAWTVVTENVLRSESLLLLRLTHPQG